MIARYDAARASEIATWSASYVGVTVYPNGLGRDVERGEVIMARDLEIAPARVGAQVKALQDEADKAWAYANVGPLLPPAGTESTAIQSYADMLSARCDARGRDPISDSVIEQLRAISSDHRAVFIEPPRHNSRCPRCAGPAYVGLLHVECERVGGCRTAEERVAYEEATVGPCVIARIPTRGVFGGEPYWQALTVNGASTYHPSRDIAVAAWRERSIAAERCR